MKNIGWLLCAVTIFGLLLFLAIKNRPEHTYKFNEEGRYVDTKAESSSRQSIDAAQCIQIKDYLWSINYSLAEFDIIVQNECDKDVKDIQFRFIYYADSGTKLGEGYETAYEIFPAASKKTIRLSELAHSKAKKSKIEVVQAHWLEEEGKVNLDW